MTAIELGYRTTLFEKIGLNVELYYNEIGDIIDVVTPMQLWPFHFNIDNAYNAIAKGIEVSVDFPITSWWMLRSNYTFQEMENKRANKDIIGTPKHKINLISSFTFKSD